MTRAPQLAPLVALGGVLSLGAQAPALRVEGGGLDDHVLAKAAFGRPKVLDAASLAQGRAGILATDRYRQVEVTPDGLIRLDPWPPLEQVSWEGDPVPPTLQKTLMPSLRRGIRLGDRRAEAWRQRAETRLREAGYPDARVATERRREDRVFAVKVVLGPPALVREVVFQGKVLPYGQDRLLELAGIRSGSTLWTEQVARKAQAALRKRFLKDHRYQGAVAFEWLGSGRVRMVVDPGPEVLLAFEGEAHSRRGLKDRIPLLKAGRYGPELLEEGDRSLLRHLFDQGYPDALVGHRVEVLRGTPEAPDQIRLVYTLKPGPKVRVQALQFEGNEGIPTRELQRVAGFPARTFSSLWTRYPVASPAHLGEVEARIRAHYLEKGFSEVSLRRRLLKSGETATLVLMIREGERRVLRDLDLEVPKGSPWSPMALGESLVQVIAAQPQPQAGGTDHERRYSGDRAGVSGVLAWHPAGPGETVERVSLRIEPPVPYVKNDLGAVLTSLRQKVASLGVPRPQDRLALEPETGRMRVHITVPPQPLAQVRRLAVFGADDTKGHVLVREAGLEAGAPLDPRALANAQVKVGNLRAFQRVDLLGLHETTLAPGGTPWQPGDLFLGLEERSPWTFTGGFGYDKSQGYHLMGGVQRGNLGGQGRTLDFGLRVGDATLDSAALRKAFPTGNFKRSLDSVGLTYTDPSLGWDLRGLLPWLPERMQYRAEAAYIEELQTAYRIRRRRVLNDFEWRLDPQRILRAGHRYERVEVASGVVDLNNDDVLNKLTHTPGRAVISAPFLQLVRDGRDNPYDPTQGKFVSARLEFAGQVFGSSANTSFLKVDARHQWNWALKKGTHTSVISAGVRIGIAYPTQKAQRSTENPDLLLPPELPLSERFFAGGPFTHRGVEPDFLGPWGSAPLIDPVTHRQRYEPTTGAALYQLIPLGGQAMALVNLEFRFPLVGQSVAGEIFLDSGQVYRYFQRPHETPEQVRTRPDPLYPPFLTALGGGLIWKVGIPIKVEYAADIRRILGRPRSRKDRETQLRGILLSAGFQF